MKERIVKIPVFRTKTQEEEIELFNIDRDEMVDRACELLNGYCNSGYKIIIENGVKNYTNEVVKISAQKRDMNGSSFVFIKMSAHKTNMGDGYIEVFEKVPVTKDTKIGSDHYYVLLYPMVIKGRKNIVDIGMFFCTMIPIKIAKNLLKWQRKL